MVVWAVGDQTPVGSATGSRADITAAAWSPDGRGFASAAGDGTITVWDGSTRRPTRVLTGHGVAAHAVAYAPDGRTLYSRRRRRRGARVGPDRRPGARRAGAGRAGDDQVAAPGLHGGRKRSESRRVGAVPARPDLPPRVPVLTPNCDGDRPEIVVPTDGGPVTDRSMMRGWPAQIENGRTCTGPSGACPSSVR